MGFMYLKMFYLKRAFRHVDKAKGGRIEGGRWGWLGWLGVVRGKWRHLYLNNNKKERKKEKWPSGFTRMKDGSMEQK